jgi:hypothetical protein
MFSSMRDLFETTPQGWTPVTQTVSSAAYNGNRSYTLTMSADVSATLSPGMRVRTTRTVSAPTQCTSLNGSTQYFNDTSITGMTFTDDFVVSAWVKLNAYNGANQVIASRYNGTSGWALLINSSGQVYMGGFNAGAVNVSQILSYQSVPLNKWVHVTAQLDMSTFTATTTTSYVMLDGVNVLATVTRGGTNPTALVQAGNLEIGSFNGGTSPFNGKIAQVAIFSAKVTQATVLTYISQGLSGTETNLVSAYSFNGVITDLNTTNANNLTAQGSAVATNDDSPFTQDGNAVPTGTTDYGIIRSVATTTVTVQTPEGNAIPTSGGVSAISYSTQDRPYGMPTDDLNVLGTAIVQANQTGVTSVTDILGLTTTVTVPVNRQVKISLYVNVQSSVGTDVVRVDLNRDSTQLQFNQVTPRDATATTAAPIVHIDSPTSGSQTYKGRIRRSVGTGNINTSASLGQPALLVVELI